MINIPQRITCSLCYHWIGILSCLSVIVIVHSTYLCLFNIPLDSLLDFFVPVGAEPDYGVLAEAYEE